MSWLKKLKNWVSKRPADVSGEKKWPHVEALDIASVWHNALHSDPRGLYDGYTIICYDVKAPGLQMAAQSLEGPMQHYPVVTLRTTDCDKMLELTDALASKDYIQPSGYVLVFKKGVLVTIICAGSNQDESPAK